MPKTGSKRPLSDALDAFADPVFCEPGEPRAALCAWTGGLEGHLFYYYYHVYLCRYARVIINTAGSMLTTIMTHQVD